MTVKASSKPTWPLPGGFLMYSPNLPHRLSCSEAGFVASLTTECSIHLLGSPSSLVKRVQMGGEHRPRPASAKARIHTTEMLAKHHQRHHSGRPGQHVEHRTAGDSGSHSFLQDCLITT
ncbi:hypothetical protein RRG08_024845 [Elysia crispata]|uniref:Uncharacterized protein n=1 Tax=Elysia crispata TaxID=231223 RepID=A0AAE0YJK8_9GAST|nr:hypothetical protein RRG08_024845 [Elysia crispata]